MANTTYPPVREAVPVREAAREADPIAGTELPIQPPGEVERREQAQASFGQKPTIPPHTTADVEMSAYMDREEIAKLAYHYWLAREGRSTGSADADWFRAEQELRSRPRRH